MTCRFSKWVEASTNAFSRALRIGVGPDMVQNDTAIAAIGFAQATVMTWKKSVRRA